MSPSATCEIEEDQTTDAVVPGRWAAQQHYDAGFVHAVSAKLNALRDLAPGWDGYRAKRVQPDVIEAAIHAITAIRPHLSPRPHVAALASGGLQLEWVSGERTLEVEFETADKIHYLRWQPSAHIEDEDFADSRDIAKIEFLIGWFVRADA